VPTTHGRGRHPARRVHTQRPRHVRSGSLRLPLADLERSAHVGETGIDAVLHPRVAVEAVPPIFCGSSSTWANASPITIARTRERDHP